MFERLGSILGTRWTSQRVHNAGDGTSTSEEREELVRRWKEEGVEIPLSVLIAPYDFLKELRKQAPVPNSGNLPVLAGEYVPDGTEGEIVDMSRAAKADFFNMLSNSGIYPAARPQKPASQSTESQVSTREHQLSEDEVERLRRETPLHRGSKDEFKRNMPR